MLYCTCFLCLSPVVVKPSPPVIDETKSTDQSVVVILRPSVTGNTDNSKRSAALSYYSCIKFQILHLPLSRTEYFGDLLWDVFGELFNPQTTCFAFIYIPYVYTRIYNINWCYFSMHRIVVEKATGRKTSENAVNKPDRRRRETKPDPCGDESQLVGYQKSMELGLECYIAAEIPDVKYERVSLSLSIYICI